MTHNYEILNLDTVVDYLARQPDLANRINLNALASVTEIGDGNLNLVFRIKDEEGKSIILKQALPYVRMTGEGWPMTPTRAEHEAHSLKVHHNLMPELVVNVLQFDPDQFVIVMEDLFDHRVWRTVLNEGGVTNGVANKLGAYVAQVAFHTSMLGQDRGEVAKEIAHTQNPEICTITEDLVFTEPVVDAGRNVVLPENEVDARELSADPVFHLAMARAKWKFMTEAQALIHGDLHTGSVMVKVEGDEAVSVKAFDSEFAFYGPIGYDLGALFANYVFAAARAGVQGDTDRMDWALGLIRDTWTAFAEEFAHLNQENMSPQLWNEVFVRDLLQSLFSDMQLFGLAKMSRRIVGAAKVTDIETLEPSIRAHAARGVLHAARSLAGSYRRDRTIEEVVAEVRDRLVQAIS